MIGPNRRLALSLGLLALCLVPSLAVGQTGTEPPAADAAPAPWVPAGLRTMATLATHAADPGFLQEAFLAQLEQQRSLPVGSADQFAASRRLAINHTFRNIHPICDTDLDGVPDLLDQQLDAGASTLHLLSGRNGTELWRKDNLFFVDPVLAPYDRPGREVPREPWNAASTADVNGDGACDVIGLGYRVVGGFAPPLVGTPSLLTVETAVQAINGRTGETLWRQTYPATATRATVVPIAPTVGAYSLVGFPTGFLAYDAPDGPRFVLKTSDVNGAFAREGILGTGLGADTQYVNEHLVVANVKDGATVWRRDLLASPQERFVNFTWISGVGDVAGDGAPEVVLDRFYINNPRSSELADPVTGRTLFQHARGMSMLALKGDSGADLWSTTIFDETTVRPNLPLEENFQTLLWTHGEVLADANGDNKPDPLATYVTREAGLPTSVNGGFVTHFQLLNGTTGLKTWTKHDVRIQGVGYAAPLGSPGHAVAQLGIAAVDMPTQAGRANGRLARFPLKEVRMGAVEMKDGSMVWQYSARFAQDTYLSYVLTVNQFLTALAPSDWDGDGFRDMVTPARYVKLGADQVLVSTQTHEYDVLSGRDGHLLHRIKAWGANGFVVPCGATDDSLTVVSGQARRLDVARFDVRNDSRLWRRSVWIDPVLPRAATASLEMTFLTGRCASIADNTTFFALNAGLHSMMRGNEILPLFGRLDPSAAILWEQPFIPDERPIAGFLELQERLEHPPESDLGLAIALGAGPLLPGIATGAGLVFLRDRRLRALMTLSLVAALIAGTVVPMGAALPGPAAGADLEGASAIDPIRPSPPGTASAPLRGFVDRIGAGAAHDPATLASAVQQLFHERGLAPPPNEGVPPFDGNATIDYTYNVGDANGDGVDDLAIDSYCIDFFTCPSATVSFNSGSPLDTLDGFLNGTPCGPGHRLAVQSGTDGAELWNRSMVVPHPVGYMGCAQEYVIGTLPLQNGTAPILVYRYSVLDPMLGIVGGAGGVMQIEHEFFAMSPAEGKILWSHQILGSIASTPNFGNNFIANAVNAVVNPILQVRPAQGVAWIPNTTKPALFLEGVGFEAQYANTLVPPPGWNQGLRVLESYQPNETVTSIDPYTGQILWSQPTLQPQVGRSVLPLSPVVAFAEGPGASPNGKDANYWSGPPCCFDVTGDGVPDPAFATLEWTPTPSSNSQGPYFTDSRLVVFDGATGRPGYSAVLVNDSKANQLQVFLEPGGDMDGDGAADLLVHLVDDDYRYEHILSVRSGKDGHELWQIDNGRNLRAWPLGDADGDGGSDLVVVSWFDHFTYLGVRWPFTNVTATPVVAYAGKDGRILWQTSTVAAPIDTVLLFDQMRFNGAPDLDGDGAGDLVLDDPVYLPDLTIVHRQRVVSGRDASTIFTYVAAGSFAFPTLAGDVNRDGADDLCVLTGDVMDLWVTFYDGASRSALWSRRILSPPITNYYFANPRMHISPLLAANATGGRILLDFQLTVQTETYRDYTLYVDNSGASQRVTQILTVTYPRVTLMDASDGSLAWSTPTLRDPNLTLSVRGPTPGSVLYAAMLSQEVLEDPFMSLQIGVASGAALGGGSYLVGTLVGALAGRRWIK